MVEKRGRHTFLSLPMPLVRLVLFAASFGLHRLVASCPSHSNSQWLVEELEALHLINGGLGAGRVIVDDEGLPLGLEVLLRDDFNHIAKFREDCLEGARERL